jgi:hypothetical protein
MTQRKQFEAWARHKGWNVTRCTNSDDYAFAPARAAWDAWQDREAELAQDAACWRWAVKRNPITIITIAYSVRAACEFGLDQLKEAYAVAMRQSP